MVQAVRQLPGLSQRDLGYLVFSLVSTAEDLSFVHTSVACLLVRSSCCVVMSACDPCFYPASHNRDESIHDSSLQFTQAFTEG